MILRSPLRRQQVRIAALGAERFDRGEQNVVGSDGLIGSDRAIGDPCSAKLTRSQARPEGLEGKRPAYARSSTDSSTPLPTARPTPATQPPSFPDRMADRLPAPTGSHSSSRRPCNADSGSSAGPDRLAAPAIGGHVSTRPTAKRQSHERSARSRTSRSDARAKPAKTGPGPAPPAAAASRSLWRASRPPQFHEFEGDNRPRALPHGSLPCQRRQGYAKGGRPTRASNRTPPGENCRRRSANPGPMQRLTGLPAPRRLSM